MILAEGDCIAASILPMHISEGVMLALPQGGESANAAMELPTGGVSLYDVEKELIRQALEQANGNKTTAARLLHITRDALRYKVRKYNLN